MTILFDDRERAAEYQFAHGEELTFLANRAGVEALGLWAGEQMGLDRPASYAATLVDAHVGGTGQSELLAKVRTDLERSGASEDTASQAVAVLSRAIAEAALTLHGTRPAATVPAPAAAPEHHRHEFWGWDV